MCFLALHRAVLRSTTRFGAGGCGRAEAGSFTLARKSCPMELVEFVLARIEEEEASWRALAATDDGFTQAMQKGLQRCGDKRRAVRAYQKKPGRRLREPGIRLPACC
jgi:hypothetical protein